MNELEQECIILNSAWIPRPLERGAALELEG